MKLALTQSIIEFTNNGLQTWMSRITQIHSGYRFSSPIEDILLLSRGNMVICFKCLVKCLHLFQYPQIVDALLDRCLKQVSGWCYCTVTRLNV
jgi:hypothetical protein